MGSYFTDHSDVNLTGEETLTVLSEKKGLAMFMHPGRYDFPVQWYLKLYKQYEPLIGLELFNGGETKCLEIWDSLLTELMPQRPVWGFSNDDAHTIHHFGRNWNVFILPGLSEEDVRRGMEHGLSYYVYAPDRKSKPEVPLINSVKINSRKGEIHISGTGQDSIVWISGGRKVFTGDKLELGKLPEISGYVRAVLYSNDGKTIVGTQPFGIKSGKDKK